MNSKKNTLQNMDPDSAETGFNAETVSSIVLDNRDKSGNELSLSGSGKYPKTELRIAASTLDARKKIGGKLKEWFAHGELVYPNSLCLEQCSSESTAGYKSRILFDFLNRADGLTGADFTGGLGIDTFYISKHFVSYDYYERNADLCRAATWNFPHLGAERISVHNTETTLEGLKALAASGKHYSSVFLDPARRDARSCRVFGISDCEPDVLGLKDVLFELADVIMLKLSPMIDITDSLLKLKNICQVHILSVRNECKELLFLLKKNVELPVDEVPITAAMIGTDEQVSRYTLTLREENESETDYDAGTSGFKGKYLYEPDKAILKAGAFKKIAVDFRLKKLDRNVHLYLSDSPASEDGSAFPGRIYSVEAEFGMDKKSIRQIRSAYSTAEITTRNLPLSSDQLRKKIGIKDGPEVHLFGLGLPSGNVVLATKKR